MDFLEALFLIIAMAIAFSSSLIGVRWWISKARLLGFVGRDMNKPSEVYVAEAGGIWVSLATAIGLLSFIGLQTYIVNDQGLLKDFASISLLSFMSGYLGFLDDLLGWKKGLRASHRILLMAPISLPLIVLKVGVPTVVIPFIGVVDLGLFYYLVLIPVGVVGASNGFNMLAGYNGLEAAQGILLLLFTSILGIIKGTDGLTISSLIMVASILGFLVFNKYPARVFPGNTFTYSVGAYFAALTIVYKTIKFSLALFTLYFIELMLFLRGLRNGVYKENFGIPREDGTLIPPYDKSYSLTHFAIRVLIRLKGRAREPEVVLFIAALQTIVGLVTLFLFEIGLLS
ncbi:MraY family glycosyltransferase [Thermogladius sp. 4427co]|uniref:MraY family glycosyltransferase n=1 Tax=Thermogladius sp. 4427co TaxID=3450718 RepID=UPI003F7AC924